MRKAKGDQFSVLKVYAIAMGLAIGVGFFIRSYWIEVYRIPSSAMRPTLEPGDTIFVSKMAYSKQSPVAGDVVVYSPPQDQGRAYIRRVVGLAGDRIRVKSGKLFVNGQDQAVVGAASICGFEKLANDRTYSVCWEPPLVENIKETVVPEGSVFVLGDLRSDPQTDDSLNSEKRGLYGVIPSSSIKGRALWIWLSVERAQSLKDHSRSGRWYSKIRFDRMFKKIQ